ncbi:MAG: hypothetical protein ACK2UO_06015 [Caldilineaceae bacterium]
MSDSIFDVIGCRISSTHFELNPDALAKIFVFQQYIHPWGEAEFLSNLRRKQLSLGSALPTVMSFRCERLLQEGG